MPIGKIEICNMALRLVNCSTINSLDEASDQARKCKSFYDMAVSFLLRELPWHFALACFQLAPSAFVHPHWRYTYGLPSDMLYALRVFPSTGNAGFDRLAEERAEYDWRFEVGTARVQKAASSAPEFTKMLFTDCSAAMLEYIVCIKDETLFDAHFTEALTLKLAALLAPPLTGDTRVAQYYESRLAAALQHARVLNADEGRHRALKQQRRSKILEVRRGRRF